MSTIVEQTAQRSSTGNIVVHVFRLQQLACHLSSLAVVLQRHIHAFLTQALVLQQRTSWIAEKVGHGEAEVLVAVVNHICRTCLLENRCDEKVRVAVIQTVGTVGSHHHRFAVEVSHVHVTIDIQVADGSEREIDSFVIGPQVNAEFPIVQHDVHLLRHNLQ